MVRGTARLQAVGMVAVLLGLLFSGCAPSSGPSSAPFINASAPDFALPRLGGGTVTLESLRGHPVLLNFWATWCPACRVEMPYLQSVYDELSGSGLVVLGIDIQEKEEVVRGFMQEEGLSFPIALDLDGKVTSRYGVRPIPTSFLIDKEGVIRGIRVGAFRGKEDIVRELKKIM